MRPIIVTATCLTIILAASTLHAGDAKVGFIAKLYKGPEGDAKYVVYVPKSYTGDKAFPLILFLHGAGETGTDGEKQVKVGLAPAIKKMDKFPFIAVFPQSQKGGWQADKIEGKRAMSILAEVEKSYKVDSKRIYLTGLSMGGFGTWSLAAAHPRALGRHRPGLRRRQPQHRREDQGHPLLVLPRRRGQGSESGKVAGDDRRPQEGRRLAPLQRIRKGRPQLLGPRLRHRGAV